MTDKRHVRQSLKRLRQVGTWKLLIMLLLVGMVCATLLRINNNGMVERRNAVMQADRSGDETALRNNLFALQRYASAHMNAGSGVIYLEESYKRDTQKAFQAAQASMSSNNNPLALADATCKSRFSGWSQAYVHCVAAEQAKYPAAANYVQFVPPSSELYRHEFISPVWSIDFAGFSVVLVGVITGVILLRLIGILILKALLRKHYSSI